MAKISSKDIAEALYASTKSKSGAELERTLGNAVEFLSKNKLLSKAPEILGHLERIRNRDIGIVSAKVTSRNPISKHTADEIKTALKNRYKASEIHLNFAEDPSLLGGIKIEAKDEVIDLSLKNKLNQLQAHLLTQSI